MKVKGVEFEFADGSVFVLPPLSLGAVEVLQDRLMQFRGGLTGTDTVIDAVFMALQRNYPDITRDRVAFDLIDLDNMNAAMEVVMNVSGLSKVGEMEPEGNSSGQMSTPTS